MRTCCECTGTSPVRKPRPCRAPPVAAVLDGKRHAGPHARPAASLEEEARAHVVETLRLPRSLPGSGGCRLAIAARVPGRAGEEILIAGPSTPPYTLRTRTNLKPAGAPPPLSR